MRPFFSWASPSGPQGRLTTLVFHRVQPRPDPLFPEEPCVERFDQIIGWIGRWFNVLPLDEAVGRLRGGQLPERAAAITFDDGYADNLSCAAPVLQRHGVTATFFIASGFLDGGRMWNDTIIESIRNTTEVELDASFIVAPGRLPLSTAHEKRQAIERILAAVKHLPVALRLEKAEQVREACRATPDRHLMLTSTQLKQLRSAGMGIGAHTVSHPILVMLDGAAARKEIAEGREFLASLLGEPIPLFAYPNGSFGRDYRVDHVEMVRSAGFAAAFSTNWGAASSRSDPYQLPRFTPWDKSRWRFGLRLLKNYKASFPGEGV